MSTIDRFRSSLSALVRELFPSLDYLGCYLYSVAAFDEGAQTADLQPVSSQLLPMLSKIPVRAPGLKVKLVGGDQVLVGFQNGDPGQPYIASLMTAVSYTTALAAARQGDMTATVVTVLQALLPSGSPVPSGYVLVIPASAASPTFVPGVGGTVPLYGVNATGSALVKVS